MTVLCIEKMNYTGDLLKCDQDLALSPQVFPNHAVIQTKPSSL